MRKILMCEPNISEGRDLSLVESVVDAVREVDGVKLLEYSSDPDHNRSVITFVGEPDDVLTASKAIALKAFELIDMSKHKGAHPRFGAVDVAAFIPIRGMKKAEAVTIAKDFGKFVGDLGVPVYFYEDAASRPERKSLPEIRKGEYEGLKEKLASPVWIPDEGPAEFNPKTGAMVTGSRFPLVAFNVNLRTTNIEIANQIARAVRYISGGFRYVRGLGFYLEDRQMVQVSMNLTNYSKTPIHRVFEMIKIEAERYGVEIDGTEIVGPLPLDALEDIVKYYLRAGGFSLEQVVESALLD